MPEITKEEFVKQAAMMWGEKRVTRQAHTIQRCDCGESFCGGWKFDPGPETDPLFVYHPPIMEV